MELNPVKKSKEINNLKKKDHDKMAIYIQEFNEMEVEDQKTKQNDHTDEDISLLIDNDSCNSCFSKDRIEIFKSGLEALLSRIRKPNLSDELTTSTDDLLPVYNAENVTVEQQMKLHQILGFQMKRQKLQNFNSEYRNPAPQNVDVDSGVSETMEPSESSNWDNEDDESNQDLSSITPQSSATFYDVVPSFDQATLITICLKLNTIDDHLDYFNTVNSLILKRAVESMDKFENEAMLDRDNYLFLKTVRGALIHKMLGEQMTDQVLETMTSICQNIDEILDPQFEVLFDINESFCFEEWSEKLIEHHSDKKDDSYGLLYVLKKTKSKPRLEALNVEKSPEHGCPKTLLSICKQLKSYVLGDFTLKINKLFDEASKRCDDNNLDLMQDCRNVKLLKDVKLILMDQTSDNWLPITKTNEMKQVIEDITTLLKKVTNQSPKTKKLHEYISKDEIKTLVLNYCELTNEEKNDLIHYFEIMKRKNNEFYNKITTIIQQDITLSDNNESSFVVDKVNEVKFVISDDDDDYDLTEVVSKAKQIVEDNFCESINSELEIPTFELSSDEN